MNIRICQLTSVHKREDTRIYEKICKSLAKNGFEVHLIVADGKGNEQKDGIQISDIGLEKNRIIRILKAPKKILKKALEINGQIYQFHDPELFPIGLKLKRKGKKVIFDSHEYLPDQLLDKSYLPKFLLNILSNLTKKYYKRNIKKLDAVFSVTPHIVDKLNITSKNARLLTNYPIIKESQNILKSNEYCNNKNNLYYAGTIYRSSQQNNIIKAIENIDNIEYSLVGDIDESYKNNISSLKAWEKVKLYPFMPKKELLRIAKKATIGIAIFDYIPNLGYKVGSLGVNKIFEYMLFELPVICTDFILWKEIVDKYNCGICVNPNDIKDIEKAIRYLATNKEEAYQMGQNGKNAVLNEFNWTTQEKLLIDTYQNLLKNE